METYLIVICSCILLFFASRLIISITDKNGIGEIEIDLTDMLMIFILIIILIIAIKSQ